MTIPTDVADRVERRLPRSQFDTVDEYVAYVLGEVLAHVEEATEDGHEDRIAEDEVEARLRSLGYLE